MWGNITIESNLQSNFNVGFTNMKSDVLIHLTQWQYWWWFWFSFLWAFYYLTILRVIRFRSLKFRPRIATTFRPHGKWGDLIVCIIPVSWCANIISNSNFILRMIEWQSESGLLTVRIRGKQWYWIYKFELKTLTDIITVPKNVGWNKWKVSTPGDMQVADDYLHVLQLRAQNRWVKTYWDNLFSEESRVKDFNLVSPQQKLQFDFFRKSERALYLSNIRENGIRADAEDSYIMKFPFYAWYLNLNRLRLKMLRDHTWNHVLVRARNKKANWNVTKLSLDSDSNEFFSNNDFFINRKDKVMLKRTLHRSVLGRISGPKRIAYNYNDFVESNRLSRRPSGTNTPLRLIKYPISNKTNFNFSDEVVELFRLRFNDVEPSTKHRPYPNSTFLILRQKRYKRKKVILPRTIFYRNEDGTRSKNVKYSEYTYLSQNKIILKNADNATRRYRMLRKYKNRYELSNLVLSKRLLRTKRTLVLPAHVNITAITNSYDVIHSWFIPGLGLKMDCIPGRATHHTFYIDNVGFYYGQCAEICGRYHHHMPIRICALPFEHFMLWWQNFGIPRLLFTKTFKRYEYHYGFRKYVW